MSLASAWIVNWPKATRKSVTAPRRASTIAAPSSCSRSSIPFPSIDDGEPRALRRVGPVRLGAIGDLIAHARQQLEGAPVGEIGVQFAGDAEKDVTLLAPVVGDVAGRVVHDAHANGAKLPRPPRRDAGFTGVACRLHGG